MSACGTNLDLVQNQKSKVIFLSRIFITWKAVLPACIGEVGQGLLGQFWLQLCPSWPGAL